MVFHNQESAVSELKNLAKSDRHSILIHGVNGCGKTWLAKQYHLFVKADEYIILNSKIQDIKDFIPKVYDAEWKTVLCIENIDYGVDGVSQSLLKLFEEPPENLYIILTARNIKRVPTTILSRSAQVYVKGFRREDLMIYAKEKYGLKAESMKADIDVFCKNPSDIDFIFGLKSEDLEYVKTLSTLINSKNPVATSVWKMQSIPSGAKIPMHIILRSLYNTLNPECRDIVLQYDADIDSGVPNHVILSAMVLNLKSRMFRICEKTIK